MNVAPDWEAPRTTAILTRSKSCPGKKIKNTFCITYRRFMKKFLCKQSLGRPRMKWDDNIKVAQDQVQLNL
jgi:hypothetical protein